MNCYPYKIDGLVPKIPSPLGGLFQGDVFNRYDSPLNNGENKMMYYATYSDLYPNFAGDVTKFYKKQDTIPPLSLFGNATGLQLGEYTFTEGISYQNNYHQKMLLRDGPPKKIRNL